MRSPLAWLTAAFFFLGSAGLVIGLWKMWDAVVSGSAGAGGWTSYDPWQTSAIGSSISGELPASDGMYLVFNEDPTVTVIASSAPDSPDTLIVLGLAGLALAGLAVITLLVVHAWRRETRAAAS